MGLREEQMWADLRAKYAGSKHTGEPQLSQGTYSDGGCSKGQMTRTSLRVATRSPASTAQSRSA